MRVFLPSLIVIIVVSAIFSQTLAQKQTKIDYGPKCSCQFGYGGNACVVALACGQEGGRCTKPCVVPSDDQSIH